MHLIPDYKTLINTYQKLRTQHRTSYRTISEKSGVSLTTLKNHFVGVHRMDADAAIKVAATFGYHIALIPANTTYAAQTAAYNARIDDLTQQLEAAHHTNTELRRRTYPNTEHHHYHPCEKQGRWCEQWHDENSQ